MAAILPKPAVSAQALCGLWYQDRLQKTESQTKAEAQRMGAESSHKAHRLVAQGDTDVQHPETEEEVGRSQERERAAQAYSKHPALLRMLQL